MTLSAYVLYIPVVRAASQHTFIEKQNMMLNVDPLMSIHDCKKMRIIKQRTVECSKGGEIRMNNIEKIVYALYGLLFGHAFVDAHDLIYGRHAVDGFESMVCNQVES